VRAGIDPNTVYFRGRCGSTAEDLRRAHDEILASESYASADDYGTSPDDLVAERQADKDPYGAILSEAEARRWGVEKALERQIDGPPNPEYSLGTVDALLSTNPDNPIFDAGVEEAIDGDPDTGSYLDVYDRTIVGSFEPGFFYETEEEVPVRTVSIRPEHLAMAALTVVVHINYKIVNEDIA